jgi:hypothetical protein
MSQSDKLDTDTEYNHIKNQNKMDAMNNMDLTNEAEQVATNENGVELDNIIARTHESCEYHQDNKEYIIAPDTSPQTMHSVNIGLTQSDDSLSSHNASYCYGNQVEYAASGWYGNIRMHHFQMTLFVLKFCLVFVIFVFVHTDLSLSHYVYLSEQDDSQPRYQNTFFLS